MIVQSSKSIKANDTEVGQTYKRDGIHMYYMRVTNCGSVREPDEGCLFVNIFGSPGVITKFSGDTLFKPVNVDMVIDD